MPLSLAKAVLFLVLVAALALGGIALSEAGGAVRIWAFSHEFTLGPLAATIAAFLLLLAFWAILALLRLVVGLFRFLNGDTTALSRRFDRRRERRGHDALAEAMRALASGEPAVALSRARRAERLLHRPDLTGLLTAQAAEAAGDGKAATEAWRQLLNHEDTRFIAIRGLVRRKMDEGDRRAARRLAEKALALRPRHGEMQDILLRLQGEDGDWEGARRTLAAKLRSDALPRSLYRRRDAVLAAEEARALGQAGRHAEAQEVALEANRLSPDLVPAAVMAAQVMIARGERRAAARALRRAWVATPHPELAAAFAGIFPDESPAQRLRRFKPLFARHPDDAETLLTRAELWLAARDFDAAAAALGEAGTEGASAAATQRGLAILAAVRRGQGAPESEVRSLLARALAAPRGRRWCCEGCGAPAPGWSALCPSCGGFDTLAWKEPPNAPDLAEAAARIERLLVDAPALVAEQPGVPLPATDDAPAPADANAGAGPGRATRDGTSTADSGRAPPGE